MGNGGTHLHARTFTAERQPRTDGEKPAKELHRQKTRRWRLQLVAQHRLDLRDAAARGIRREAPHQPRSNDNRDSTTGNGGQEPGKSPIVSPSDRGIAEPIGCG